MDRDRAAALERFLKENGSAKVATVKEVPKKPQRSSMLGSIQSLKDAINNPRAELAKFGLILGPDENVLDTFACAYYPKNGLLVQGKMIVTQKYIAFSGWPVELRILLSLRDTISLQKASTALNMLPNAIEITTKDHGNFFFGSFLDRDQCFYLLQSMADICKHLTELQIITREEVETDDLPSIQTLELGVQKSKRSRSLITLTSPNKTTDPTSPSTPAASSPSGSSPDSSPSLISSLNSNDPPFTTLNPSLQPASMSRSASQSTTVTQPRKFNASVRRLVLLLCIAIGLSVIVYLQNRANSSAVSSLRTINTEISRIHQYLGKRSKDQMAMQSQLSKTAAASPSLVPTFASYTTWYPSASAARSEEL